jgi:hypothetical protein
LHASFSTSKTNLLFLELSTLGESWTEPLDGGAVLLGVEMHIRRYAMTGVLVIMILVLGLRPLAAQTVSEFTLSPPLRNPASIATGSDGALWSTSSSSVNSFGHIVRMTPDGTITNSFLVDNGIGAQIGVGKIIAGPDGALWFTTDAATLGIGRITTQGAISFFPIPHQVFSIAFGSDGNLWFPDPQDVTGGSYHVERMTPNGFITPFAVPSKPAFITAGPDGALWFTGTVPSSNLNNPFGLDFKIARITTGGAYSDFTVPSTVNNPDNATTITTGPDGALWFIDPGTQKIGRMTTADALTLFPVPGLPAASSGAGSITPGPDGALWFADSTTNSSTQNGTINIDRITTSGVITEFSVTDDAINDITAGPNGAMWFVGAIAGSGDPGSIGRISVPGVAATLTVAESGAGAGQVTSGPSGITCSANTSNQCAAPFVIGTQVTLTAAAASGSSFAGWSGGGCGGIAPCTLTVSADTTVTASFVPVTAGNLTLVAAVLPTSRSVQVGGTATAFATMIDVGPDNGSACTIAPSTSIPASFVFQTTNPATNALSGTANAPANIAAGQAQSFVIALTPTAAFAPTNVAFTFTCANAPSPAATTIGVDTLNLSASTTPVPDVVALAASADPGIVDIPGATGTGVFAVATVNVGASSAITATANTGSATLPVTLTICQTNPSTGVCLAAPAASVATTINANATPTFGIFVAGGGTVPFSPGVNRVFVTFTDNGGVLRGETSVAVRTQ